MSESVGNSPVFLSKPQDPGQVGRALTFLVSLTAMAALLYAPLAWGGVTPGTRET